ncbi:hypothetical protein CJA_2051 [Cellvibrio japonicus Ueda107]|uniref:Uncharacterized protein n=1 Tax=Cellvibrio japonicus (strain Ueda107) TaxID=498211 RepID=B3PHQ0_CELJU|nr:hypothetical protein CJA_2051 [Cellvibrio japonicus Ueda107]
MEELLLPIPVISMCEQKQLVARLVCAHYISD